MEQMRRYGIPASVTLAQGIIESGNGNSTLSQTANNHFGVKGTYNGAYVLANDDHPNEKFKKYDSVEQSYEDHSKVLMADRYQRYVGQLAHDDYKGWAAGIKKGGYASSATYDSMVVSVIEANNLQRFDQMVMEQMKREGRPFGVAANPLSATASQTTSMHDTRLKATGFDLPKGQYSMPVQRDKFLLITSPYGNRADPMNRSKTQMHHGIDIRAREDAILATENNGKIVGVDERINTGGGKTVTVEYTRPDGSRTQVKYMHLSKIDAKVGDVVSAGQKLGVTGNTGVRTTGPHLHFAVINIDAKGQKQWVNPAAYLAELNQKGNLQQQAQYNGKDLLAQYQSNGSTAAPDARGQTMEQTDKQSQQEHTPESWMQSLLLPDAAMGLSDDTGKSGSLLETIMQMFMTLLMLAIRTENKDKEEKREDITNAFMHKRVDLSSFVPNLKSASLTIKDNGTAVLSTHDGRQEYHHELTVSEQDKISQILHSNADDATKKQRLGSLISVMTYSQQASMNYEQMSSQERSQQQSLQR